MLATNQPTWRLLVIANETLTSRAVCELVASQSGGRAAEVFVIAPALSGRVAYWSSDDRKSRRSAEARLRHCLDGLGAAGLEAEGAVGDADPLLALADGLAVFAADEVLIATHPPGTSCWLERDVVTRARERFDPPIHHLVVEGEPLPRVAAA
ncbi:MAG: permease [Gaiellaceae bacterium]|nr:permease [Gaiellaceae bacterium]